MAILVTGVAGFIGYHVATRLLDRGETVIGVDNVNAYYDTGLKEARLAGLCTFPAFTFHRTDIADKAAMAAIAAANPSITHIIHLAAQAGVRYSLVDPHAYTHSNVEGHLVMLEMARCLPRLAHMIYASSSSVYGGNQTLPFRVTDPVDRPLSLYAATKRANELMSHTYAHLFDIPLTGLRFFTVYGPWGRPDMSAFLFTKAILAGDPIRVFNNGDMRRDFTYIDDIVAGILAIFEKGPKTAEPPARVYNIGNSHAEPLMRFIGEIERAVGREARIILEPMQPGDVKETYADIEAIRADYGFFPTTGIEVGVPSFVAWYRQFYRC